MCVKHHDRFEILFYISSTDFRKKSIPPNDVRVRKDTSHGKASYDPIPA